MKCSQPESKVVVSATKLLLLPMISLALFGGSAVCVRAQDTQQKSSDEAWTATTEASVANTNPSRTLESHAKSGNRSVDKERLEVLGLDGRYVPASETEKETAQINATTTRTVVRTYTWDGNGRKKLAQVTEEEARSAESGDVQAVSTTSSSDVNGNLHVVQRVVADTRKTNPDVQETKTTVYLADGNGGFTTSRQTQELQKRSDDQSIQVKKTTLVPDGNGNWQVGEVKEKTIKEDGKNRTTEERVLRPVSEGRLSETLRTVGKETETATGERSNTVETYSGYVPGSAPDGSLHLNQKVTTLQKKDSGGESVEQQVEQPPPGNPSDHPQISEKTKYIVRYGATGTYQTRITQARDGNGDFNVVSTETRKSDQVPPAQVQTPPSDKPR